MHDNVWEEFSAEENYCKAAGDSALYLFQRSDSLYSVML